MSRRLRVVLTALLFLIPHQEQRNTLPEKAVFIVLPRPVATLDTMGPYDSLLRQYADSIGWDWRLLASVVYHESRFHNEARSSKGAIGLMQILSSRYTEEELLNPSRNLEVGTRYLKRLEGMFPAATPVDAVKFALAAYNLGEGRVGALVAATREAGEDASRWENVAKRLPTGHHTVSYVEKVLDSYSEYCRLYPR